MKGIVGKLALGEADAGFVYATDVRAASSRLVAIPLPKRSQPTVLYEVAVVKGSKNREAALEFVADLLSTDGGASSSGQASGSREKPVRRGARVRDRRRPLVPAPPDRRDLPPDPAGPAPRRDERSGRGRRALVTLKTTLIANVLILLFGTPTAYLIATRELPRPRARSSPPSSCRWCCRRQSPGSGSSPPSGGSACSAGRSASSGSRSRSRRSPSSWPSRSSRARSTSAPRSRPSRRWTPR